VFEVSKTKGANRGEASCFAPLGRTRSFSARLRTRGRHSIVRARLPGRRSPANVRCVERVRYSDLIGVSDKDRASVAMFYYGYLAAKARIHIIDVSRIDANIAKLMRQCAAAPNLTVPQAFRGPLRLPAHG
jgi:hypothetical protein